MTLFRGVRFAQDTSIVEQVDPVTGSHSAFITKLTSAIAILPVRDRANTDYLVLQFASSGPFFGGPGLVLRFASPNSPGAVVTNCLTSPTSMALDAKTSAKSAGKLFRSTPLGSCSRKPGRRRRQVLCSFLLH